MNIPFSVGRASYAATINLWAPLDDLSSLKVVLTKVEACPTFVSTYPGLSLTLKGLRIDELSLKCLLYAEDQVILAASASELQKMVTKMNVLLRRETLNTEKLTDMSAPVLEVDSEASSEEEDLDSGIAEELSPERGKQADCMDLSEFFAYCITIVSFYKLLLTSSSPWA
ncbi:hypothetical protein EVAR_43922_1 [Eumeta japonica]|uniref:Reverse transcriptase domain-containing protein n=1 Tax=Eumeta variegata TaxID=151549 RepID=A0A4C1WN76_EUMVA|nr:hypothetical protein EVAR_43922_1 [Eumeta japonica]